MSDQAPPSGSRLTRPLLGLVLACAFSFGAMSSFAVAHEHFHTNCVPHGFVHGTSTTDGSFHSRVESGCGSGQRRCAIYSYGSLRGEGFASGGATCNLWSNAYGNYTECASTSHTYYNGVFSDHVHKATNWCG